MKKRTFILTFFMMFCSLAFGQNTGWGNVNPYDYEKSMTVVSFINVNESTQSGSNFEVGAFCGNEMRGKASIKEVVDNNNIQHHLAYITIYGNADGETISFKLYDKNTQKVIYPSAYKVYPQGQAQSTEVGTITFVANGVFGTTAVPYTIRFDDAAKIGSTKYATLAEAFKAAEEGQTVEMLRNVTEDFAISSTNNVTFNMAGYTLTGAILPSTANLTVKNGTINNTNKNVSAIEINAGTLTLESTVTVNSARHALRIDGNVVAVINGGTYKSAQGLGTGTYHAANISGAANVTILGGTFVGPKGTTADSGSAIKVQTGATVAISGGEFSGGKTKTLSSDGTLSLTGGKYDQDVQNYCAEGYMAVKGTDGWYTVVEAAAQIVETGKIYPTLADAFAAATEGQTVVMLRDVTEDFAINNTAAVTFDMAGKTLTGAIMPSTANLTVKNGTIVNNNTSCSAIEITSGSIVLNEDVKVSSVRHAIRIDGAVAATIKGGEYTLIPKSGRTHHALNVSGAANVTIEGGKFVGPKGTASDSGSAVNVQSGATVAISGGEFSGGKTKTLASGGSLSLTGGRYDQNVQNYCAEGYMAVKNGEWYEVVKAVAKIAETGVIYKTLQAAIDACVEGNNTIVLLANISDDVTVSETSGVNITIDGQTKEYSGTINVVGNSTYGEETLTIKNVKFVTSENGHDFIWSDSQNAPGRYCNNINVDKCYFVATGAAENTAVGLRIRQGKNINVTRSEFVGLHSAMQMNGTTGINAIGLIINGKNGISASGANTLVVDDCRMEVEGYGVRADGADNSSLTLRGNTIAANLPVVVRKTTGAYNLVSESNNTFTASNENGYAITFTNGNDGTYEYPTGDATATIVGNVAVFGMQARIGNVYYTKFDNAYAAASEGQTIELFRTVVLTNDSDYSKAVTVKAEFNEIAFRVKANVSFNNMTIISDDYCVIVGAEDGAGKLTINGGTYKGETTAVSVTQGELNIMDGTFQVEPYQGSYEYTINCIDANYQNGTADVSIQGGKFYNFNPQNNAAEGAGTNFLVAGYAAAQEGDWYIVNEAVAQIVETGKIYATLAEAIAAAQAGNTLQFLADITEDVTVSKDVTIDGAGKTYTGKMTLTSKNGTVSIKNVNFDGKGYNGYAVETRGVYYVTIEDCTAKNYGYGFVQQASSTVLTTVKNVTVSNMNYGVKVDYGTDVVLENVDITAGVAAVLNSNYGEKTITIKNSKLNIVGTWKRNDTTKTTYVFEGANTVGEFKTEAALDSFKLATVESTLTAPNTVTVTTDLAGHTVKYAEGKYFVSPILVKTLEQGWNWFSSYIDIDGTTGFGKLKSALGTSGLQIKGQLGFVDYSTGWGWNGSLESTSVKEMYMIQTSAQVELVLEGNIVNPAETEITLQKNWTYIGYPVTTAMNIEDALGIIPQNGDVIKTHDGIAMYYKDLETENGGLWSGWDGSLQSMTPGMGYMYKNTSGEVKTLVYPAANANSRAEVRANVTAENNYWAPNASAFANNMNIIAVLESNDMMGEFEVAAFVNGEVRGSARPTYVEPIDAYVLFMTIYGEEGEEVSFKYYDIYSDEEHSISNTVNYSDNAVIGSIREPYMFFANTLGMDENAASTLSLYPNPTTTNTAISFETTFDMVEVFNSLGAKVAEYRNVDRIEGIEAAGVYVIRVTNDSAVQNCRLIVK